TNYLPYQSDTLVSESTTATNGTSSTATFAAKVDYNKPAGLYSIAFDLKTIPIVTQTYMQDMDPNICKTDSPTIVIDSRDEQPYLIQRLDDGKCWMLDNLNLDLTNKTIVDNITTANTHVDAASLKSLKEGNRTDCGEEDCSRYATSGLALENWISGAVYSVPHVNKGGTCSTKTTYPCEYDGVYTNNTVLYTLISDSTFGLGSGKIGVYYNYCAASAGNYCYGDGGKSGTPPSAGDEARAQYDICPANWRLPTGGSDGEFRTLCTAINGGECSYNTDQSMDASDANSMQHKFSLLLSGFVSGGIGSRQGNYGVFWSSSYASSTHIFAMRADVTDINLRVNDYRYNGESVRCILNES
ncbi:hypothetical protein IKF23_03135, partial [Candidatus Saccharibacteria bacterium]|nr:hypothetical protein [Candidatus Saccharibacteria bacterium]